jgi:antibiotic biosynthesis monooxygenase (ABM) superfamily enzyme
MICRIWHGWTTPENAGAYEHLLRSEIFRRIAERGIPGYRGIELLRRVAGDSVEFVTLMWFDSVEDVRGFAGVRRFDARSAHYEVRQPREAA